MLNGYYISLIIILFFIAISVIIWDLLPAKKIQKQKNRSKRVCPKCKSTDVKFDWEIGKLGEGFVDSYKCNKCRYTSRLFPEIN